MYLKNEPKIEPFDPRPSEKIHFFQIASIATTYISDILHFFEAKYSIEKIEKSNFLKGPRFVWFEIGLV